MPSFGRVQAPPDARDRLHRFAAVVQPRDLSTLPKRKAWRRGPRRLDQGNLGACVAFAGGNWKQSYPLYTAVNNQLCFDDYWRCKDIDGIPNIEGTYARALMKVYEAQGRIERYLWAYTIEEALTWLQTKGPLLIGVNWYRKMSEPRQVGNLYIAEPQGVIDGGHEVEIDAGDLYKGLVRFQQSWGGWYGNNGQAWMTIETLERLLFNENGDCVTAIEKRP